CTGQPGPPTRRGPRPPERRTRSRAPARRSPPAGEPPGTPWYEASGCLRVPQPRLRNAIMPTTLGGDRLPGFTAGEQPVVHLLHLGPALLPRVLGHDVLVPLLTHARRQGAIGEQHGDVLSHHMDIPERNETSAPPVLHHSTHAAGIAADH